MGLLDVNMPLLYREGKRAFLRPQEEIMKSNNEHTLFSWHNEPEEGSGRFASMFGSSSTTFRNARSYISMPSHLAPRVTPHGLQIELEMEIVDGSVVGLLDCIDCRTWPYRQLAVHIVQPYSFEDDISNSNTKNVRFGNLMMNRLVSLGTTNTLHPSNCPGTVKFH